MGTARATAAPASGPEWRKSSSAAPASWSCLAVFTRELFDGRRTGFHLHDIRSRVHEPLRALHGNESGRQVAAEKRLPHAAAHRLAHDQHLFERDLALFLPPEIHAHRVAGGNQVGAGALGDLRHRRVPGHYADDLRALALHALQAGEIHQKR
jgi:hypothetical protein